VPIFDRFRDLGREEGRKASAYLGYRGGVLEAVVGEATGA
jgi:hypothetical protein